MPKPFIDLDSFWAAAVNEFARKWRRGDPLLELELEDHAIEAIEWSDETRLQGATLLIGRTDLEQRIGDLCHGMTVNFELARPGESKRIVHVLDTVMPIAKADSDGVTFPGFEEPAALVGSGRTIRINNLLVTVAGRFPHTESLSPIETPREGIVDMSGVGAEYSYGSDHFHLILCLQPDASLSNAGFDEALRHMALRLGRFLANAARGQHGSSQSVIALPPIRRALPKVVLIYQAQSQVMGARTFYYGEEISRTLPTYLHPAELFDGAVVSGNYKSERKIPTSLHCANPFILELLHRHGVTIEFLGVILSRGYNDSYEQKKKLGLWVARLARNLGAAGAVAMMEGTGNGTVDFMQTVKACENEGIKTAAVLHESDGPKGYERPLVDHPSEADGMISRGNVSEKIYIPPLGTVVGDPEIDLHFKAKQDSRLPFLFDPTIFFGSYNKMGQSGLRADFET